MLEIGASSTGTGGFVNPALEAGRRSGSLGRRILLVVDHLLRADQFLLGNEQGGIDGQGFLKLGNGFVEFAVVAQLLAVVDDGGGGLEADAFEGSSVAQILGLEVVGLLEEIVGGFVLLASLGVLTLG